MALYSLIFRNTRSTGNTKTTALSQMSNTNRQQIVNDNSNSIWSTARSLSSYQFGMRTRLLWDSKGIRTPRRSKDAQTRSVVSATPGIYSLPDRVGNLWRNPDLGSYER
ncbi:hypothetical protein AVEN_92231-1 [Araneus ventricosus]|uniref:Uncharacterized protein n=1 Tax=Araneus ventricosus TaxID=182803 RepID=A0A4Y2AM38_ARAVE|nr:hypothetical protein AVEN_92231-1 [Araneus ventricosus]